MYKDTQFDENNPSKDNIENALGKLLYCLTAAKYFADYKEYRNKIDKILEELNEVIDKFVNTSILLNVPYALLDTMAREIEDLDYETLNKDGLYLEMASVWISILIGYYDDLNNNE